MIKHPHCELADDGRVYRDGGHVGTVRQDGKGWRYESLLALGPYREGRADTRAGALAHLGFRVKEG